MPDGPRNDVVANAERAVTQIKAVLDVLPTLLNRDREQVGPDGYPVGGGGGRSSEVSRPTETIALARMERPPFDLVHDWTVAVTRAMDEIARQANIAAGLVHVIDNYVDQRTGRQSTVKECRNCHQACDRLRASRCAACYVYRLRDAEQRDRPARLWA